MCILQQKITHTHIPREYATKLIMLFMETERFTWRRYLKTRVILQTIDEKSFQYRTSIESKSKWLHKILWLYRNKEKKWIIKTQFKCEREIEIMAIDIKIFGLAEKKDWTSINSVQTHQIIKMNGIIYHILIFFSPPL